MPAEMKLNAGEAVLGFDEYVLVRTAYSRFPINPDLLLLLTTSGSTGSPKLVRISEKNLLSNAKSIADYLGIGPGERAVTSLPMHYSYGMSVINSHLLKGATLLLTDKPVMQKPFWEFVRAERATSIAGVPYTYEMLRRLRFMDMNLPDLKTMTQAGGKLKAEIAKEFIQKAKERGKKFIVMYGQTEASPRMSYLPFDWALEKYSSIGIPIPGGRMFIADSDGTEIENPLIDGDLVYEGPNVCMGYAENKDDLMKGDENHGRLLTGDIAHKDADGFFYITGRKKRFVKVWGNRCNLDALEQLVKNITTECACVGVDDKITIFVTETGLETRIKEYLCEKTGFNLRAFDVSVLDRIPTKDSGKIDYQQLQRSI
jgi:acyl-coenzyme A synthetase/AMP-(fatty) acid ligase